MIQRSRRLMRAALLVGVVSASAACGGKSGTVPAPAASGAAAASTPKIKTLAAEQSLIKHVVVVILENRSFDNLMHDYNTGYPTATSTSMPTSTVNRPASQVAQIASSGVDGTTKAGTPITVPLQPYSFNVPDDVDHSHAGFLEEYDGGKNDGWNVPNNTSSPRPAGSTGAPQNYPYGYLPQSEVQPYLDIAHQFTVSDQFFHGVQAPTFPSHIELGAGSTFGVVDNPSVSIPWGCDAAPGATTGIIVPTATTPQTSVNENGPFPCFDDLSIFDLLDRSGVGWKYYSEPEGQSISGNLVIPAAFRQIRFGQDWNTKVQATDTQFATDVASGNLPPVSYVIPDSADTDHAGTPSTGPNYVRNLVNEIGCTSLTAAQAAAAGGTPGGAGAPGGAGGNACAGTLGAPGAVNYYANTVILITWDDWGGWFDSVVPKILDDTSLSYRKPLLIVSAYAKHGMVTHVPTEDASTLKFQENLFGLGTLGQHDARANDLTDAFDFAQTPPPFKPITSMEVVTNDGVAQADRGRAFPFAILGQHAHVPYDPKTGETLIRDHGGRLTVPVYSKDPDGD